MTRSPPRFAVTLSAGVLLLGAPARPRPTWEPYGLSLRAASSATATAALTDLSAYGIMVTGTANATWESTNLFEVMVDRGTMQIKVADPRAKPSAAMDYPSGGAWVPFLKSLQAGTPLSAKGRVWGRWGGTSDDPPGPYSCTFDTDGAEMAEAGVLWGLSPFNAPATEISVLAMVLQDYRGPKNPQVRCSVDNANVGHEANLTYKSFMSGIPGAGNRFRLPVAALLKTLTGPPLLLVQNGKNRGSVGDARYPWGRSAPPPGSIRSRHRSSHRSSDGRVIGSRPWADFRTPRPTPPSHRDSGPGRSYLRSPPATAGFEIPPRRLPAQGNRGRSVWRCVRLRRQPGTAPTVSHYDRNLEP